ncbi:MAG: hypothetical protein HYZ11_19065, partial [Candidatus Tectomicrobia bacterium]|nr:hypothetical protein [Candidatus Tectomicrobia bacterium]
MASQQNRIDIDIQIQGNAQLQVKQLGGVMAQMERDVKRAQASLDSYDAELQKLAKTYQEAIGKIKPSALERMRLAIQELQAGYVEGMGEMTEETLTFAEVLERARLHSEDVAFSMGRAWEGFSEKFKKTFTDQAEFALKAGEKAFDNLHKTLDEGLTKVFTTAFTKNTDKTLKAWDKFVEQMEGSFYASLGRMASAIVQENLLAPAFKLAQDSVSTLLGAGKNLLGLAQGGLVTKPTLAVVGEAGPELVIPLKAAGEFVKDALVEAAGREAVKDIAAEAGLAEGLEAAASAGTAAAAATSATLFVFVDAMNQGAATRLAGDLLFGQRGSPGIVNQGLAAIGLKAFGKKNVSPEEHGRANLESIRQMTRDFPGFYEAETLIAVTGGNPFLARELMGAAGAFRDLDVGGDAAGRFITGPSLRLLGERGPEHVLNVDSEPSVRALREGLRPVIRELFEEER